jgi:hypothetical protein
MRDDRLVNPLDFPAAPIKHAPAREDFLPGAGAGEAAPHVGFRAFAEFAGLVESVDI